MIMQTGTSCITDSRLAEALWPGADVRRGRGDGIGYLAAPTSADPRFLLPADRAAAAAVVREFRHGGNGAARWRSRVVRAALATTGGWPVLHHLTVQPAEAGATVEDWTAGVLGRPVTLGVQLGPRRANRKPILQVLDEDLRPLAVGKVGSTPLTRGLVATEAEALRILGATDLPGMRVPGLVHRGRFAGSEVVLGSPLPLRRASADVSDRLRRRAMVGLARCLGTRRTLPADSGILGRLHAAALTVDEPDIRAVCLRFLDLVANLSVPWELGCWHGDWTTWNMAGLGDEVLVWDWERFDADVPLGWDELHFVLRREIEEHGPRVAAADLLVAQSSALLEPFGVPPALAPYVAGAYLVALALRYTVDGQRAAGGGSARVEEWMLPVLEELRVGGHA